MSHKIERSALVARPAATLYDLVVDVERYPQRFGWCREARILEREGDRLRARLDVQVAGFKTWFVTENRLMPPHEMTMDLADGPFRSLHGLWQFKPLREDACKVSLLLEFEPASALLGPVVALGMNTMADRMVDDFVRAAEDQAA